MSELERLLEAPEVQGSARHRDRIDPDHRKQDRETVRRARARAKARSRAPMPAGAPDFDGPLIELREITRFFPGPPPVNAMRGIDFTVERGEYVAITGASGSGKSTMLNTLGLLDRPSTGTYRFEGVDTAALTENQRAALRAGAVGFVFQSFHLLPTRSVLENVMLAGAYGGVERDVREARARAALERVGLGHRMGFSPAHLSGGERQRVAVARAVSGEPRLLLADEPTGNLDRKNTDAIMALFRELREEGLTIVLITHDEAVARAAERRVHMLDGELTELS